jgi:hypothetical protein
MSKLSLSRRFSAAERVGERTHYSFQNIICIIIHFVLGQCMEQNDGQYGITRSSLDTKHERRVTGVQRGKNEEQGKSKHKVAHKHKLMIDCKDNYLNKSTTAIYCYPDTFSTLNIQALLTPKLWI